MQVQREHSMVLGVCRGILRDPRDAEDAIQSAFLVLVQKGGTIKNVASKKNDLLDALVQLELDQRILEKAQKHVEAVPQVFVLNAERAVQEGRNASGPCERLVRHRPRASPERSTRSAN